MNETYKRLESFLRERELPHRVLEHDACRSSAESYEARRSAGVMCVGAKALVSIWELRDGSQSNVLLVLPGDRRINSRALKQGMPHARGFHLATLDELSALTGLERGAIPPFGQPVVQGIDDVVVDPVLADYGGLIGFNAGALTRSIVLEFSDYLKAVMPARVFHFSEELTICR